MAKKKKGQSAPAASNGEQGEQADEAWRKVPGFLQRGGGEFNGKLALREEGGERKVVAVEDVQKGERVFKIPRPCSFKGQVNKVRSLWLTAGGLACYEAPRRSFLHSGQVGRAALKWARTRDDEDARISRFMWLFNDLKGLEMTLNARWSSASWPSCCSWRDVLRSSRPGRSTSQRSRGRRLSP